MNSELEREAFEKTFPHLDFSRLKSAATGEDFGYENVLTHNVYLGWQARAALSTEAQPEVKGAVYQVQAWDESWLTVPKDTHDFVAERPDNTHKTRVLYPPSAIEAAVREKLEEAAQIVIASRWLTVEQALEIAEPIRALMESPQPSVEEPAN